MPTNTDNPLCPVCKVPLTCPLGLQTGAASDYDCPNCGKYTISYLSMSRIDSLDDKARAVLSAGIRAAQNTTERFVVNTTHLEGAKKGDLSDPVELLDRLILYVGEEQESPGRVIRFEFDHLRARLKASCKDDVGFAFRAALDSQLLVAVSGGEPSGWNRYGTGAIDCRLTMKGWQRFHELQRGAVHSRTAFMAMPFRNADVRRIVDEVFRPAVEETGFRLKRVDEEVPAGSIDDRIRVEIRLARFMIADLTGGNQGAYWEAGYAEGMGKPVIYTCSKAHFDKNGTHFDTNHRQTVVWDLPEPEKAAESLKATIRATLPFEAKMSPDQE